MGRKNFVYLLLFIVFVSIIVYSMVKEPHTFQESECPTCHEADSSGAILGRQLKASMTALCSRCHAGIFTKGYTHPTDVAPRTASVPLDMPLSSYGQITCNTCHDIHSSFFTPYGAPTHYLRRYEAGKAFCAVCHIGSSKPGHKETLGEAHFQSKYIVTSDSQTIDAMSKNCISCHDGSFASSVSIGAGSWTHNSELMKYDMGSHPIGVDYEAARTRRGRKTDLNPMAVVDQRIRFFDGKVGCGSCHDPYSTIEKELVMSDEHSQLCFSCHKIDRR